MVKRTLDDISRRGHVEEVLEVIEKGMDMVLYASVSRE